MFSKLSLLSSVAYGIQRFGPQHCVSVARNASTGTCVLETNCGEMSLNDVEFAFTCKKATGTQKHSFGKGGFDSVEKFDTSVQCDVCGLASEVNLSLKKVVGGKHDFLKRQESGAGDAGAGEAATTTTEETTTTTTNTTPAATANDAEPAAQTEEAKAQAAKEEPAVSYGPQNCIETWLLPDVKTTTTSTTTTSAAEGTTTVASTTAAPVTDGELGVCMVRTKCANVETAVFQEYPIGVIASNKDGVPVRHLFGANSFEKTESFNTLIRSTACYGMDQTAEAVTLENEIKALSKVVYSVKQEVDTLKGQVGTAQTLLLKEHRRFSKFEQDTKREQEHAERARRQRRDESQQDDDMNTEASEDADDDPPAQKERFEEDPEPESEPQVEKARVSASSSADFSSDFPGVSRSTK